MIGENYYLAHHGVKGQKWGVRHDKQSLSKNYTQKQFNRDKGVYGKATAKRFKKKMEDKNQSIQGLRSKEAERIANFRKAAGIAGKVGGVAGAVGGFFGGKALVNKIANGTYAGFKYSSVLNDPYVKTIVGMGAGAAGASLGKIGAETITMAIGGYSRNKLKDDGGL